MKTVSLLKNLFSDQRRVALVIALNIVIVIIESTIGVISGSLALLSDAWHNLSDVLALVVTAVVLGGGAMIVWGIPWVDSLLSLMFAAVILIASGRLLSRSFGSLMDRADPEKLSAFEAILILHPQVTEVHDIHLTFPSSKERYFSAHIVLDGCLSLAEVEAIIESLRHDLSHAGATHILLQPETAKYGSSGGPQCNGHSENSHAHNE